MRKVSARTKKVAIGVTVGCMVGALAGAIAFLRPALFEHLEASAYDLRAKQAAPSWPAPDDIVFIEVSDQAIVDVQNNLELSWPWPRELFGYLGKYAADGGAQVVVYDWLFQDRRFIDDAETFAQLIRDSGRVVLGLSLRKSGPDVAIARGRWGARLSELAGREEAEAAALRLLAWDVPAYIVGDSPSQLFIGGYASRDEMVKKWEHLATVEELAALFADGEGNPRPAEPTELSDRVVAGELTAEAIIRSRDGMQPDGEGPSPSYGFIEPPLPVIAAAPTHLGAVYQQADFDGVTRRYAPLVQFEDRHYPSLAFAAWLAVHPGSTIAFEDAGLRLGELRIPLDDEGRLTVRYYHREGSNTYPAVSASKVLRSVNQVLEGAEPEVPPEFFRGKYVFVAPTAVGLRDLRNTPINDFVQGAEVNANVLGNILHQDFIVRASAGADAGLAFFLCVLTAAIVALLWTASTRLLVALVATVVGGAIFPVAYWLVASWAYQAHGLWLGVATPVLGAGATAFAVLLVTTASERRDRRFVQEALGRYTSPALVRELTEHPEYLSLEWGETREMSVYFSDIAGFTTISESLAAEKLVALLNDYLTEMTTIVLAHDGVIDKYIGDAIMAFWGAPLRDPDHARKAVTCAVAMRNRLVELTPVWEERFGQTVTARAGINSGQAVVGNMGSKHKFNYTVMGDMVNLASRLEGANKPYGTALMISESTAERVRDAVDLRRLDIMAVKGKDRPVEVFEVLDRKGVTDPELLRAVDVFHEGLRSYRSRDFQAALVAFERAVEIHPDDGPALMYIDRCKHFALEPPPEDWDGVWRLKEK